MIGDTLMIDVHNRLLRNRQRLVEILEMKYDEDGSRNSSQQVDRLKEDILIDMHHIETYEMVNDIATLLWAQNCL